MDNLTIEIANLCVHLDVPNAEIAASLKARYRDFLSDQPAIARVRIDAQDDTQPAWFQNASPRFMAGRISFSHAGYHGFFDGRLAYGEISFASNRAVEEIDYFLRVVYALLVFEAGGLLFHAAGIVRGGQTYIFFGASGAGKTTVARLSPNDIVLNDDLLMLLPDANGWRVYATPFWNPTQIHPQRLDAPLRSLLHLVQDKTVSVQPISAGVALGLMVSCVPLLSSDPSNVRALISRCSSLLGVIPCYDLHFLPDDTFWRAIEDAGLAGKV